MWVVPLWTTAGRMIGVQQQANQSRPVNRVRLKRNLLGEIQKVLRHLADKQLKNSRRDHVGLGAELKFSFDNGNFVDLMIAQSLSGNEWLR